MSSSRHDKDTLTASSSSSSSSLHDVMPSLETASTSSSHDDAPAAATSSTTTALLRNKLPAFNTKSFNSFGELETEIKRLLDAFDNNLDLSPYAGGLHDKRRALSRVVASAITNSNWPNTYKIELFNTAIRMFDHRSWATLKAGITAAVRLWKPTDNPTPVIQAVSQTALIAARDALAAQMREESSSAHRPT